MTEARHVLERKIDVCFGYTDQNRDGVIDSADVLTLAARLIAASGEPYDSPKSIALLRTAEDWWDALRGALDVDGDGRIDPDEYRSGMLRLSRVHQGPPGDDVLAAVRPLWALCDRDDDGQVTAEEFGHFQRALGVAPDALATGFTRLDLDGDGTLSVEELATALWEFWTSEDPDAAGNWLFGDAFLTAAS
ncbi:calcium-binding protein [Streptomyces sp. NPDC020807]|uniref:EF-hand domain-containing protein n=1 Tax=Streptomyces sp. NPDC020807 TaxID=3155119 RepID=UPI00340ACFCD